MQAYLDGVRQDRTGWRDQEISERHRLWGYDCPAVDLDFLIAEYNVGMPVGLIEYKHHKARTPNLDHPTHRALKALADGYAVDGMPDPLPYLIAFYWPDVWAFRVTPVNDTAKEAFAHEELLTEREFVSRLYELRRRTLDKTLAGRLNDKLPESEMKVPF